MRTRAGDAALERVARAELADRDHWRCGICGRAVSRARTYPDPLSASVDHVIPLADAGGNDLTNLQLTHLRCNLRKNRRLARQPTR